MMFILFFLTAGNSMCLLKYISTSSYCSDWNKDCCLEMCDRIDDDECNIPLIWFIPVVTLTGIAIIYIIYNFVLFDILDLCYKLLPEKREHRQERRDPQIIKDHLPESELNFII